MKRINLIIISIHILLLIGSLYCIGWTPRTSAAVESEQHNYLVNTVEQWQKHGASFFKFTPVISYDETGDKNLFIYKRLSDSNGYNYYVSYPPGIFILTYIFHQLGMPLDMFWFQWWGIILYLLTGLLLTAFAFELFSLSLEKKILFTIIFGLLLYSIPVLNFKFLNYYFPELWGMFFSILGSVYFLFHIKYPEQKNYFYTTIIFLFLAVFTEWIGLLACVVIFFLSFFYRKFVPRKWMMISVMICFIALGITALAYMQVDGVSSMLNAMSNRAKERSAMLMISGAIKLPIFENFKGIVHKGVGAYGMLFFILANLAWFVFLWKNKKSPFHFITFFVLMGIPLFHFLLFFDFSIEHGYPISKLMIPLCFVFACCFLFLEKRLIYISGCLVFIWSMYLHTHSKAKYTHWLVPSEKTLAWLDFIKNNTQKDESILLKYNGDKHLVGRLYTHIIDRNIVDAENLEDACKKAVSVGQDKIAFFEISATDSIISHTHISSCKNKP